MTRLVECDPDPASPLGILKFHFVDAARAVGLNVIPWTLERLKPGISGYYNSYLQSLNRGDRDIHALLYVLANDVGVLSVISVWYSKTTFLANCIGNSLC